MVQPKTITAPNRFWVVRKPDSGGTTVAKFDTIAPSNTDIVIPDSCVAYSLPDRANLETETVDTSKLTAEEKDILTVLS